MLTVRMNDVAASALKASGTGAVMPPAELAPMLRETLREGIVRRGEVLLFAGYSGWADEPPGRFPDLTGWECFVSSLHLDDAVPVKVRSSPDGEPVISEEDQALMLRHGLGFALEVVRLVNGLDKPVAVRCIVGTNTTNGTFRFHRARPGESWLTADLDSYSHEWPSHKLIVVDNGPASLGGTPW
ncbi:hypothetical protein QRX60_15195 [Amycolatopsis mongoliensis]|uniref:Uncharacterized protein n=1 Tax=Amycolatopsis mongoliensis TaxID=715475 RepID=A0A9Y2NKJ8_9PSEU|nr:hypothetical protein [Amycolatopsis sp. 4-36]WIY05114.1 hypothetical protein QRX60_15195 [Amycolatopsis sp. 4-36]